MEYSRPTKSFNQARQKSEFYALNYLDSKWCVVLRYGLFLACRLKYALDKDYGIVLCTIY